MFPKFIQVGLQSEEEGVLRRIYGEAYFGMLIALHIWGLIYGEMESINGTLQYVKFYEQKCSN